MNLNTKKITNVFRAFRNRNYSLFFSGQSVSQIGSWMQRTGVSWVVYTMTHSAFMLGLTIFVSQFPSFIFSLLGGIVADRYSRFRVLMATQIASMIQAALLALLVFTRHYTVWEILLLSGVLGVINAFDVPARQPLIHDMITDEADLPNALALQSSMANLARLIGPAISGLVLVKFGAGVCFLLNALSFVAVTISLLLIHLPAYVPPPVEQKMKTELSEGLNYLKKTPSITMILLMLCFTSLLVLPYNTLIPVFAKEIFKGNAATFGYINSFIGVGAIAGSIFLAALKKDADLQFILLVNTIIFGISLLAFSHMVSFPLAMVFFAMSGFGMMSQTTISMTLIQLYSAKEMRGRVMGFAAMAYFGMLPLGSLLIGILSQKIGTPTTILCEGIITLIIAACFSGFLTSGRRKLKGKNQSNFNN
ncbi:putative MFS family arabinose efflux permease [Mucilaginibacter gracilis]|uniref:Putative MFS family arabinose efflux permease n=1 Tax=Mucilaginibacter gracilis TaxID=423350 RepID=A0A495J138_9SPHI|nr:MFS transporter [Mucilaginibacter gracilis]RKR82024.1 putative MFS family arabinose efflux permease [Mucilaginibacter gracilis]